MLVATIPRPHDLQGLHNCLICPGQLYEGSLLCTNPEGLILHAKKAEANPWTSQSRTFRRKKTRIFSPTEPLKSPERGKRSKKQEIPRRGKKARNSKKQGKEGQGKEELEPSEPFFRNRNRNQNWNFPSRLHRTYKGTYKTFSDFSSSPWRKF